MSDDRRCQCRFAHVEGLKGHEAGCPMLRPPPVVARDPYRSASPVAEVTGGDVAAITVSQAVPCPACGSTTGCLHGIPEAIGTSEEFPMTHRPGEYLGQPRESIPTLGRLTLDAPPSVIDQPEQAAPLPSVGPDMQDLVVIDIDQRKRHGMVRYGQALKAWDGRDNLRDAYEEALDLVIYLRKEIYRRDGQ